MSPITKFLFLRHVRGEQSTHVLHWANGQLVRSGRGLSFWFLPLSASLAMVPVDDREQPFLFHGHSADFQDFTVQGVITWRVVDPERAAARVDFSIDLTNGAWLKTPLEKLTLSMTKLAQELAEKATTRLAVRDLLESGTESVRDAIRAGLLADTDLAEIGLEVVSVRIDGIRPSSDLEKALQMPTRERIQQQADEATYARRAMAVDKERAIAENELSNRIQLARREEELIAQQGQNSRRQAEEQAEAKRIAAEAEATRAKIQAASNAHQIEVVEAAQVHADKDRMAIYRELPSHVLLGLAAQELAKKLHTIEHLNVSPELFGPLLTQLVEAGTKRLEAS